LGKLINVAMQKFIPATKKSILIRFRKQNGAWVEKLLPPKTTIFRIAGSVDPYYLKGRPDFDDSTNQRFFTFLWGIPYPINLTDKHPDLIQLTNQQGNVQLMLNEADEYGYQRGLMIKGKKGMDINFVLLIAVGISVLVGIANLVIAMQASGVSFT